MRAALRIGCVLWEKAVKTVTRQRPKHHEVFELPAVPLRRNASSTSARIYHTGAGATAASKGPGGATPISRHRRPVQRGSDLRGLLVHGGGG